MRQKRVLMKGVAGARTKKWDGKNTIQCFGDIQEINWWVFKKKNTKKRAFPGADLGGGCRGCPPPPPPEMTCGFLINTVQSASQLYKICFIIWYVFSAVHIMLLPSRKPSSSYSLLKFVYVTSQLRHSLVVHPLLRKILDPPLVPVYFFLVVKGSCCSCFLVSFSSFFFGLFASRFL